MLRKLNGEDHDLDVWEKLPPKLADNISNHLTKYFEMFQ